MITIEMNIEYNYCIYANWKIDNYIIQNGVFLVFSVHSTVNLSAGMCFKFDLAIVTEQRTVPNVCYTFSSHPNDPSASSMAVTLAWNILLENANQRIQINMQTV